ncbi:MAG: hypothetical protein J0I29_12965 [Rhizobiales bacterium]|nr:hypothetical protein [Hyphomicrobiales bacterium]
MLNAARLFSFALVIAPSCAVAAGAPAGALNKTVTISFVSSGMSTSASGQQKGFNTSVQRIVYISSAGRLFMKHTASNGRAQRGGTFDPDNTSTGHGGSFNFQGNKLVGVISYAGGARQITATFDPGFSSCTASVIEGAVGGKMQRKGPNGEMYTLTGVTTSSPSCSVQSGNAFAN